MITMFVVGVLVIIAIPSFISYVQNNRAVGTAENLYYSLQYARSEAIKRNTTVYVSFVTGSNWCYGINPGSACTCTTPSSCALGAVSPANSTQTTLSTTGVTGNQITFEGTHGAAYKASTITFTVYGQTNAMGVDVSPMGDLLVCSSTISGYSGC
jgi:Tfp pilus assembly protein FimT